MGDTIYQSTIPHLNIDIQGQNNIVRIHPDTRFNILCLIQIIGNNNEIVIKDTSVNKFNITIRSNNCRIIWGSKTTSSDAKIILAEHNSSLTIGEDCMLANADIRVSDGHTIYDIGTKKILNHCQKNMTIGNHCWIGQDCLLTKNANLCDNVIVAAHSVVTKSFNTPYTIIGGLPAKIIKSGVSFVRPSPSNFGEYYVESL